MDGGYEAAQKFVLSAFADTITEAAQGKLFSDYKSEIQETLQKNGRNVAIVYETDKEEDRLTTKLSLYTFHTTEAYWEMVREKAKKEAEQNAAKSALAMLKRSVTDVL